MGIRRATWLAVALCAMVVNVCVADPNGTVTAEDAAAVKEPIDLFSLSLEQLMSIKVTSVAGVFERFAIEFATETELVVPRAAIHAAVHERE